MSNDEYRVTADARFQRAKHAAYSRLDDEILVVDASRSMSHRMSPPASQIWLACIEGKTPDEIAQVISDEFEVELEQAKQDVLETISTFLKEEMVRTRD